MPDRDPSGPDEDGAGEPLEVSLDADFVRAATIKEPSARARMLAQKWAKEEPSAQPFRSWEPAGEVSVRAGRGGRRLWRGLVALVVLLGLLAGALALYRPGSGGAGGSADPVRVSAPVLPAQAEPEITAAHPFAGSPAEHYANGAAGIVLPKATAAGRFTAAEVGAALNQAKTYLIAADLNRTTLVGGSTAAVRILLDPKGQRQPFDRALRAPSAKDDPLDMLTRFDPKETQLVGSTIKVHGTTSYRSVSADQLVVHVDYLVVYAVRRPAGTRVTRVIVRHILDLSTYHNRDDTPGTVWVWHATASNAGARCSVFDGFIHPSYPGDPGDYGVGPAEDPYDQRPPSTATGSECGRATRI